MATRRDQLQSYQFMTQRVISAFIMRETDPQQSPLRRGIGALFGGLMIAVLVGAGFGVYGILTKVGSDPWQTNGSVVIENETGASFVYFDGVLHPTLNYASAMLAAGRPSPPVYHVASSSMSSVARGVTVGIPGAPSSLPRADRRVGLPGTVCASIGSTTPGRPASTVTLGISVDPEGGRNVDDGAVLVKDSGQSATYVVWHGRRHLIRDDRTVVPALFGAVSAVTVGGTWLNVLPSGADIAMIDVASQGTAAAAVPGRKVGEILTAHTGSGPQSYLVLNDGLAPISELQKDLISAKYSVQPRDVPIAEITSRPRSGRSFEPNSDAGQPPSTPQLVRLSASDNLCAVTADAGAPPRLVVGGVVPGGDQATRTSSASPAGTPLADRIVVPGGHVATVRALASPGATSGPYYVVTDLGIKFAVPDPAVFAMLGYNPADVVDVPASLLATLPSGPTLDPTAATHAVPAAAGG
jgi:type VII secretion protein EccB